MRREALADFSLEARMYQRFAPRFLPFERCGLVKSHYSPLTSGDHVDDLDPIFFLDGLMTKRIASDRFAVALH